EILKLSVNQRVDADASDSGLERSRGHRHSFADLERRLLVIQGANLRVLQHLRIAVAHDGRQVGGANRYLKIRGVQVAQSVERQPATACAARGSRRGRSRRTGAVDVALQSDGRASRRK